MCVCVAVCVPARVCARAHLACVKDLLHRTFYTLSDTSYCTPSDRIGRNYSPTAQGLTMRQLKTVLGGGRAGPGAAPKPAPPSPVPLGTAGSGTLRSSGSRAVLTPFPKPATTLAISGSEGALGAHTRRTSLTSLRPDDGSDEEETLVCARVCSCVRMCVMRGCASVCVRACACVRACECTCL